MSTDEIVRCWKDDDYRESLSDAEQALLPESPVGLMELTDEELVGVSGGAGTAFEQTLVVEFCHTRLCTMLVQGCFTLSIDCPF